MSGPGDTIDTMTTRCWVSITLYHRALDKTLGYLTATMKFATPPRPGDTFAPFSLGRYTQPLLDKIQVAGIEHNPAFSHEEANPVTRVVLTADFTHPLTDEHTTGFTHDGWQLTLAD